MGVPVLLKGNRTRRSRRSPDGSKGGLSSTGCGPGLAAGVSRTSPHTTSTSRTCVSPPSSVGRLGRSSLFALWKQGAEARRRQGNWVEGTAIETFPSPPRYIAARLLLRPRPTRNQKGQRAIPHGSDESRHWRHWRCRYRRSLVITQERNEEEQARVVSARL